MPVTDFLVLTALDREWTAARPVLAPKPNRRRPGDARTYYTWTVPVQRRFEPPCEYLIAAAPMSEWTAGQSSVGIFATKSLADWNPAHIFLLGIAGSLEPGRIRLGDVVVSSEIYGYEVAAAGASGFHFRATVNSASAADSDLVRAFIKNEDVYVVWQEECLASAGAAGVDNLERPPEIHTESTASGNFVVQSREFAKELKAALCPYVAAVEMEARGVYQAVYLDGGRRDALMIRGISDYADEDKVHLDTETGQRWQRYASANAARAVRAFWLSGAYPTTSPPYRLDTSRGDPTRFAQMISRGGVLRRVTDFRFRQIGAQNLAFPRFLDRPGVVTPRLFVSLTAITHAGEKATEMDGLCVVHAPEVREIFPTAPEAGQLVFELPASDRGMHVELLLSFRVACREIIIRCEDDFGRTATQSLTFLRPPTTPGGE